MPSGSRTITVADSGGPAGKRITLYIALGVATLIGIVFFLYFITHIRRIEPGEAGIRIDYGSSTLGEDDVDALDTGYYLQGWMERIVQFPISQQSLSLVGPREGDPGDDAVICQAQGVRVDIDSTTTWRINPNEVAALYVLRPGKTEIDRIQNEIVRRDVANAIATTCSGYAYYDLSNEKRAEFAQRAEETLRTLLSESHLILDNLVIGEFHFQQAQSDAINNIAAAQARAQEASFAELEKRNLAAGAIAEAEGQKQSEILRAEGAAQAAVIEAQGQADAVEIVRQQVGPDYLAYLQLTRWNGVLPLFTGDNAPVFTIPLPTE